MDYFLIFIYGSSNYSWRCLCFTGSGRFRCWFFDSGSNVLPAPVCVCVCFCFQVRVYSGVHTHQAWRQWAQAQQLLVLLKGEKLQRKDVDK